MSSSSFPPFLFHFISFFLFSLQLMSKPSPLAAKIAGSILPVVVYGLLGYTWYIYIFRICGKKSNLISLSLSLTRIFYSVYLLLSKPPDNTAQASKHPVYMYMRQRTTHTTNVVIFMIIASFFWIMAVISYTRVLFTSPGKPPSVCIQRFNTRQCTSLIPSSLATPAGSYTASESRIESRSSSPYQFASLLLFAQAVQPIHHDTSIHRCAGQDGYHASDLSEPPRRAAQILPHVRVL